MAATLAIASLVLSAVGSIIAAQQRANASRFNAKIAEQRAERERQLGETKARQFADQQKRTQARQRARFAVAGVAPSVGSPLLVQEETAAEAKFQENIIRSGAATKSAGLLAQGQADRARAGQELIGAGFKVGSSLLGAGSRIPGGSPQVSTASTSFTGPVGNLRTDSAGRVIGPL